jgi:DNA-binding MarR family transcriptional regulator
VSDAHHAAANFLQLFAESYALLHRRIQPRGIALTPEGRGLLLHLAWSGPLTIGDLALHTDRAQSVVSESVAVLESHAMLARVRDPRDRRRTLVWLTELAREWLAEEQEPLDRARTEGVLDAMGPARRQRLMESFADFIATAQRLREIDSQDSVHPESSTTRKQRTKRRSQA